MPNITLEAPDTYDFVIQFADGRKPHRVDPMSVALKLTQLGVSDQKSPTDNLAAMRTAIGLPSLNDTQTIQVFAGFNDYLSELQKKMPWLLKFFPSTGPIPVEVQHPTATPASNTGSASGSIADASVPLNVSTSSEPSTLPSEVKPEISAI